jgi:hypothetical protein
MKAAVPLLGTILVMLGTVVLAYEVISVTTFRAIMDHELLKVSVSDGVRLPLPTILGALAFLAGLLLILLGCRE